MTSRNTIRGALLVGLGLTSLIRSAGAEASAPPAKPAPKAVWDPAAGPFEGLKPARAPDVVTLEPGKVFELKAQVVTQSIGGKTFRRFAYNGSIPGPLLKVRQGSEARIRFVNETDVETTIHSHGLRLDYRNDGAVGLGQAAPVKPGESFEYVLSFPDAGVFWYHPHLREDYQQDMGLMGNVLVEPASGSFWAPVDREEVLLLDDMLAKAPVPYPVDAANHAMMGRFGDTPLVNGSEDARFAFRPGEVVRLFLTNAANARTFRLSFKGAKAKIVGSDIGPFEREFRADLVTMGPGERYVVEVEFPRKGTVTLENATPGGSTRLARFEPEGAPVVKGAARFASLRKNAGVTREIEALVARSKGSMPRRLTLDMAFVTGNGGASAGHAGHAGHAAHQGHDAHAAHQGHDAHAAHKDHGVPAAHGSHAGHGSSSPKTKRNAGVRDVPWAPHESKIEWDDGMKAANEASTSGTLRWIMKDASGAENMAVAWPLRKGEAVRVVIENPASGMHPMQHPIHFHGQRFVVLSVNGARVTNRAWKDTVLVGAGDTVEILLDAANPGKWMAHCHIAEHLTSGMMTGFDVSEGR